MMSQRFQVTKWIWFLIALYSGPALSPVRCVSVKVPPKTPSTIEAQAKFFQDFFSVQLSPYKIEFGHVCEDPNTWEQRYESKDYKNHRDMGKVRWGDKKGGYGEHYWDLNHAGHAGNHGDDDYHGNSGHSDDGSYHHDDSPSSSYDGPSDHSYGSDDYEPEKSSYEENGRAKRAHPRVKPERILKRHHHDEDENSEEEEEEEIRPKTRKQKQQEQKSEEDSYSEEKEDEDDHKAYKKSKRPQHRHKQNEEETNDNPAKEAKKKVVLVVQEKEEQEKNPYSANVANRQAEYNKFVPYEGGAGVRQHHHPEAVAAASAPRLFLEPTTGHVVDRATGQAYVLQPIALGYN